MNFNFDRVYFEPDALSYPLGQSMQKKYAALPWIEIDSHNRINELSAAENRDFPKLKRHLIIGTRKTHNYVENHKVSDWLVPYTSSGCRAMCLYCYLVCNYNKCAYLRLFVNREQMMGKLIKASLKASMPQTFEIGSNSDLVLENAITNNLIWTIENFAKEGRGFLTFPTKFDMVKGLLSLDHRGKTISRMSVNPIDIIRRVELGTSPLGARITALNAMAEAGYPVGLLIAPVILLPNWKAQYGRLIDQLADTLSEKVKRSGFIEVIFMTYSFVQNAINLEAFPNALPIFDQSLMTGRGRGKYCYKPEVRADAEAFLREQIGTKLSMNILYIT
jgi:spore photoproduct lyase